MKCSPFLKHFNATPGVEMMISTGNSKDLRNVLCTGKIKAVMKNIDKDNQTFIKLTLISIKF